MNSEELKQKRTSLGLTQSDLASAIGKSRKTINSYEQGASIPDSVEKLLLMYFDKVTKGYTIPDKKTPIKEVGSMEDLLSNAVIEKLKPLLAGVQENHSTMINGNAEIIQQIAHLILDVDELQDIVEELKEELTACKEEIRLNKEELKKVSNHF